LKNTVISLSLSLLILTGCGEKDSVSNGKANFPGDSARSTGRSFTPGSVWTDESGKMINAHGGGVIFFEGRYYWFGEKRGRSASEGVNVYSSSDLYKWKQEGLALAQDLTDTLSDISVGSIIERPKVIYNSRTKKFVMWFHLELRGRGYSAARAGVAVSDRITGPYRFVSGFRPNGNMSRDMTLFQDEDSSAWLFYSSRENADLRLARLSDDFLSVTPNDTLLFSQHREAPAVLKYNNTYYLFTSGCTGWQPNKTTLHSAKNISGPWIESGKNPLKGRYASTSFGGQSTFILPLAGVKNKFIFLADKWNPENLADSRYLWLPVQFNDEQPFVKWMDEWTMEVFQRR
jgi:beta-galactosidase